MGSEMCIRDRNIINIIRDIDEEKSEPDWIVDVQRSGVKIEHCILH